MGENFFVVGVLYGVTNVCVGHPFDTIKTKMQAQAGFEKSNMFQTLAKTLRTQGVIGLYRGCIPPLWGSGIYRSSQFAVFEAVYTRLDSPLGRSEIPGTGALQLRVIGAGVIASTTRAIIETPLEFAKVRRQTQQTWHFKDVYTGFGVTWVRTIGLMTTYFILVDSGRRHFPEQFKKPLIGPFLTSGIAATLAWWIVWPLEYMKCQIQSNYGEKVSVIQKMRIVIKERGGFFGLYRGIMPGTIRSFLANGTSMVVMQFAQRKVTELGLRD
ncbi:solute carrier family 25 (mitochondrial carnitine/acylcarnitine transporter), member 20/29 [Mytilus galloprovincialis]|uniref:Solute carrier family 25 (Mitochondrial carnitine/acylcarnitine transporter), member 20/29 n=1 Tax=Mytilus galloprovincialis TaxID=29158 RepID=A0A8B6FBE1_MYTGA|nr:solute carrier family 25 (mitochondrial carnitine/acylcarnitine transporter), member 20/29 [Mytilus galloprovincialis]